MCEAFFWQLKKYSTKNGVKRCLKKEKIILIYILKETLLKPGAL